MAHHNFPLILATAREKGDLCGSPRPGSMDNARQTMPEFHFALNKGSQSLSPLPPKISYVEGGQMSSAETGQMSSVDTGQMSSVETRQT